jgi:hypothetical protein
MRFHATLERHGKTATGFEVPGQVLDELDAGKRPAVRVTLNGYTYASSIGSMGGRFLLPVSADVRAHARLSAGDEVDVQVELDTAPRQVKTPDDLAAALSADPAAQRVYEALSYSAKQRLVLPIEQAKAADTRERRVAAAMQTLHPGRA